MLFMPALSYTMHRTKGKEFLKVQINRSRGFFPYYMIHKYTRCLERQIAPHHASKEGGTKQQWGQIKWNLPAKLGRGQT